MGKVIDAHSVHGLNPNNFNTLSLLLRNFFLHELQVEHLEC